MRMQTAWGGVRVQARGLAERAESAERARAATAAEAAAARRAAAKAAAADQAKLLGALRRIAFLVRHPSPSGGLLCRGG